MIEWIDGLCVFDSSIENWKDIGLVTKSSDEIRYAFFTRAYCKYLDIQDNWHKGKLTKIEIFSINCNIISDANCFTEKGKIFLSALSSES